MDLTKRAPKLEFVQAMSNHTSSSTLHLFPDPGVSWRLEAGSDTMTTHGLCYKGGLQVCLLPHFSSQTARIQLA